MYICVISESDRILRFFLNITQIKSNTTETCYNVNVRNHAFFATISWYGNLLRMFECMRQFWCSNINKSFAFEYLWISSIEIFLAAEMIEHFFTNYLQIFFFWFETIPKQFQGCVKRVFQKVKKIQPLQQQKLCKTIQEDTIFFNYLVSVPNFWSWEKCVPFINILWLLVLLSPI